MKKIKWYDILFWTCIAVLFAAALWFTGQDRPLPRLPKPTTYYLVDRVRNNADYAQLAGWGINTAVVNVYTNGTTSEWTSVYNAATSAGISIVLWPNIGSDNNCGWESPFNNPVNGSYIESVKRMLDFWNGKAIGIVTGHEMMWHNCNDKIEDLASVKQQINTYAPGIDIWVYVDNLSDLQGMSGYDPGDIDRIMDVAVTWQHCAGCAESCCTSGSYSALNKIKQDRQILTAAGSQAELVFIQQTFTAGGSYGTKFTLSELQDYSCQFWNTNALDGFGYYTWDEGWYSGNLKKWTELWPAVSYVWQNCMTGTLPPSPTVTASKTPTRTVTPPPTPTPGTPVTPMPGSFLFVSMSDAQGEVTNFTRTAGQVKNLAPNFIIFNGDLENDGVSTAEMDAMLNPLRTNDLYNRFFPVRGNHDDHLTGSASLWEAYLEGNSRVFPAGITDYVSLNASNDTLNYSFVYGNSIFIGLDITDDMIDTLTSAQINFLDARLTYAENIGLTHAFVYSHAPLYCAESTHCNCSAKTDASCTPSSVIPVINKHPIISAFINGHEHLLAWSHMDNTRLAGLTGFFEEFFTSPSGGWTYNNYLYPNRVDYYYSNMGNSQGFGAISVLDNTFTLSFYKVGTTNPVWSQTFTKGTLPVTPTRTPTRTSTVIPTNTPTPTVSIVVSDTPTAKFTDTPQIPTNTRTPTPVIPTNTPTPTGTQTSTPLPVPPAPVTMASFDWAEVVGATSYQLQVATSSGFYSSSRVINTTLTGTLYSTTLSPRTYYWRVRACNANGCGAWSRYQIVIVR